MKRGEKAQAVISIMESNRDKSYEMVSALIEQNLGITNKAARAYYQYMVHNGKVTGIQVTWGRGQRLGAVAKPVAEKSVKVKAAKAIKAVKQPTEVIEKTADEIAAVKAKNLEVMRKVTKKINKYDTTRMAAPEGEGVKDFDPQLAKEEVEAIINDMGFNKYIPKFMREGN